MSEVLLPVGKVAAQLGVSPRTVTNWLTTGRMKGIRLPSGRWRVSQQTVDTVRTARKANWW